MSEIVLRPRDAAAVLGLAPSTLSKMRLKGEGPAFVRLTRRAIGYRRSDLELYLAARVHGSTSEGSDARDAR